MVSDPNAVVEKAYFVDLFISSNPRDSIDDIHFLPTKVIGRTNQMLTRPILEKEIKSAFFSISPNLALGEDGFTAKFFQFFWKTIKSEVIRAIQSFFSGGKMLNALNHTHICLIPKILNATSMKFIQPISLSSVFYKVISKILVNGL
ncbi:hypothetical protein AHAS_Ahas16G0203900 [Arachis hypogaea]